MNAIRQIRSTVRPSLVLSNENGVVRLCRPSARRALACRWQREPLVSMAFAVERKQNCHLDGLTESHACRTLAWRGTTMKKIQFWGLGGASLDCAPRMMRLAAVV